MKVIKQYEFLSKLQGDNKITSSIILTPEKEIKKEKVFLPFLNERDNLGRLITHDIDIKKPRNQLFINRVDRSIPRKGVLSKIYHDSLSISSTKNEFKMKDDLDITNIPELYSSIKGKIPQETARTILPNNTYNEQNSKIEQNFERFNNHKNKILVNERRKKSQPQGSLMKLISPKEVKSQFGVPFGIYDVDNSRNYINKKSPKCFILQEHSPRLIHNVRISNPEKSIISPKLIPKPEKSWSEFKKMMFDLKIQVKSNNFPSKEEKYGISTFNVLSQDSNHLDLMRLNQNMLNKFDDTRIRMQNLKVKINDVASSPTKEWRENKNDHLYK